MARVFKQMWTRKNPDGTTTRKETAKWYIEYKDHNGFTKRVPSKTANMSLAWHIATRLEREAEEVRFGLKPPPQLAAGRTVAALVDEFLTFVASRGKEQWVRDSRTRLTVVTAGLTAPAELTELHLAAAVNRLAGKSARTRNAYRIAAKQFAKWLVRKRVLLANPFAEVEMEDERRDRRHPRRAEPPETLTRLVASIRRVGRVVFRLPPEDRVWFYVTAAVTGFRAGEVCHLTPESFRFDAPTPYAYLPAEHTKNGEAAFQPIPAGILAPLRTFVETRRPGKLIWPRKLIDNNMTSRMIQKDMADAGIPYRTDEGFFDVHALRKVFCTQFCGTGPPISIATQATRHHDPKLTQQHYIDHRLADQAKWTNAMRLPDVTADPT